MVVFGDGGSSGRILLYGCFKITVFVFQHDICSLPASDSVSTAYSDPLVSKSSSSESKMNHDCKSSTVSSHSLCALMSSPVACSASNGRVHRKQCRPKRQLSHFDDEQENINPAAPCNSDPATNHSVGHERGSMCCSPVSKKHCRKNTDSVVNRKNGSADDSVKSENYTSLISPVGLSSQRYGNSMALSDGAVKFALNCSDDRLHELIGDFSRPYCLPFTDDHKHRDLKAISCHTVSTESFSLHNL